MDEFHNAETVPAQLHPERRFQTDVYNFIEVMTKQYAELSAKCDRLMELVAVSKRTETTVEQILTHMEHGGQIAKWVRVQQDR